MAIMKRFYLANYNPLLHLPITNKEEEIKGVLYGQLFRFRERALLTPNEVRMSGGI